MTITLREGETYYFRPKVVFTSSGTSCKNSSVEPTCYNFHEVRIDFDPVIPGFGSLSLPTPSDVGMDDQFNGNWVSSLTVVNFDPDFGDPISNYNPALSAFTFTAPDGMQYKFDSNGKLSQRIDRNNNSLTYASGSITHSNGKQVTFVRDGSNRITEIRDPIAVSSNGAPTIKYSYDSGGNMTNVARLIDRAGSGVYDGIGNLIRYTNFNGVILTNQYDSLNRLTNKSSGGGYSVVFSYSATGQRATMVDASGSYLYVYDSNDRLTTNGGPAGTLIYTYDLFGQLQSIQSSHSGGASVTYNYDLLNRLSNVVDAVAGTTSYSYDGVGNLQTLLYPNGVTNSYAYDALNRLTNQTAKTASGSIAGFVYKLGAAGNRTNLSETVSASSRTFAWYYDSQYRLTNESITGAAPIGTNSYKYDAVGNRTNRAATVAGVTNQALSYNANDWLTTDVYDSNGNTRTNGSNAYFYDVENRLTNFNSGAPTFVYNADGIRVGKTVSGTTTLYLVD